VIAATPALAQDTEIQFALDWRFEGPSAPYFLAIDNGYFAEQGLSVEVTAGQGSLDAIPKVASGAFPMGFADINSLDPLPRPEPRRAGHGRHDDL
jgi:NitT/TauT family transport system substrate-binding protein